MGFVFEGICVWKRWGCMCVWGERLDLAKRGINDIAGEGLGSPCFDLLIVGVVVCGVRVCVILCGWECLFRSFFFCQCVQRGHFVGRLKRHVDALE